MAKQTFTTGQVLTAAQVNSLQSNDFNQTVSVKTAAYTLVVGDRGTRVEFNTSGSVTCTVNTGIFDAGDTVIIQNCGAGAVTVTAGTATVNTSATLVLSQYDSGTLYFVSTSAAIFFNSDAGGGSPLTTKGDLYTFSTVDARIAVGANDTVLTADSSTATGLKWATNTSTQPFLGYKVSGNLYGVATITAPAARTGVVANSTNYYAIYFDGQTTFDRIGIRTASTFSGTGVYRLGIYNASLTTGKPTTVYLDAGTVSATAASTDYLITINTTPPAGYYFIAGNCQTAASTNALTGIGTGSPNIVNPFGKNSSTAFGYNYFAESVTVTSGFATAGTLTDERTVDVQGYLRIA